MDYTMEDTQNSAPQAHEASKLGSSAQRNDTQSVTKRFVLLCLSQSVIQSCAMNVLNHGF